VRFWGLITCNLGLAEKPLRLNDLHAAVGSDDLTNFWGQLRYRDFAPN
jgi:hypothetical protein